MFETDSPMPGVDRLLYPRFDKDVPQDVGRSCMHNELADSQWDPLMYNTSVSLSSRLGRYAITIQRSAGFKVIWKINVRYWGELGTLT